MTQDPVISRKADRRALDFRRFDSYGWAGFRHLE